MVWTILVLCAAVIVLFMMRRAAAYKRLFADEHFLEIAEGMTRLKKAAHANIKKSDKQKITARDDPRVLITSQNLRVFYTVVQSETEQGEPCFEHHYSISVLGGYTATAVGEVFTLYVAHLLGFTAQKFSIERSQHGVYHIEWQFTPNEQEFCASRRRNSRARGIKGHL